MSIWARIADALSALGAGEGLSVVFDRLRSAPERSVGFTIAVIALGAKMAKSDGQVTRDEVTAFRQVFAIPEGEEGNAHYRNLRREYHPGQPKGSQRKQHRTGDRCHESGARTGSRAGHPRCRACRRTPEPAPRNSADLNKP